MKRVKNSDIKFKINKKLVYLPNFVIRFYTVNQKEYFFEKTQDDLVSYEREATVDDVEVILSGGTTVTEYYLPLSWSQLMFVGQGILNYKLTNNIEDPEFPDDEYNKEEVVTTDFYIDTIKVNPEEDESLIQRVIQLEEHLDEEIVNREEADAAISGAVDSEIARAISAETALQEAVSGKANSSDVYLKSETSGATQISNALAEKLAISDFNTYSGNVATALSEKALQSTVDTLSGVVASHTSDSTIHLTSGDVQSQIDNSISGKANSSDVYLKSETSGATQISNALDGKQDQLIAGENITISGNVISSEGGGCEVEETVIYDRITAGYYDYGGDEGKLTYAIIDYLGDKTTATSIGVNFGVGDNNDTYSGWIYFDYVNHSANTESLSDYVTAEYISDVQDFKVSVASAYQATYWIKQIDGLQYDRNVLIPFYTINSGSPCTVIETDVVGLIEKVKYTVDKSVKNASFSSQKDKLEFIYNPNKGYSVSFPVKLEELDGTNSVLRPNIKVGLGVSGWTEVNLSESCYLNDINHNKIRVTYNYETFDPYSMGLEIIVSKYTSEYSNEEYTYIRFDEVSQQPYYEGSFTGVTLTWSDTTKELLAEYPATIEQDGEIRNVKILRMYSPSCQFGSNISKVEYYAELQQPLKPYVQQLRTDVNTISGQVATKQDQLVSSVNIKTINNESLLGNGNIDIQGGGGGITSGDVQTMITSALTPITETIEDNEEVTAAAFNVLNEAVSGKADTATTYTKTEVDNAITAATATKQDQLVSSVNIKTINNESILGVGNIDIQGGGGKAVAAGTNISITTGETADTINCTIPYVGGPEQTFTYGYYVTNRSQHSLVVGAYCTTTSSTQNNIVVGYDCNSKASHNAVFGRSNNSLNEGELSTGQYNVSNTGSTDADKTLFSVGNGTASNARHNAFEIRQNGDIYLSSGGTDIKLQDHLGGGGGGGITSGEVQTMITSATTPIYQTIEDNEEVTAAALNVLNATVSGKANSSDVYLKSETSGATEISTALATKQNQLTAGSGIDITSNVISVTGGTGGGISSAECQTMIDQSISGKADSSTVDTLSGTVTANTADIATVSGNVNTISGDVATNTSNIATVSAATASNTTALGGLKLQQISRSEYDSLPTKDSSTLYIII